MAQNVYPPQYPQHSYQPYSQHNQPIPPQPLPTSSFAQYDTRTQNSPYTNHQQQQQSHHVQPSPGVGQLQRYPTVQSQLPQSSYRNQQPYSSNYSAQPASGVQYAQYQQPQPILAPQPPPRPVSALQHRGASDVPPSPYPITPAPSVNIQSPSRRPLPDPQFLRRAETDPPFERRPLPGHVSSASPAPQPPPRAAGHRPSTSMSAAPSSDSPVASTISRFNNLTMTPTATPPPSVQSPRPLPNPMSRSTKSLDLTRSSSPVKAIREAFESSHNEHTNGVVRQPLPQPGQKFVPLWKRALPSPSPSPGISRFGTTPNQSTIDRRGTVSGAGSAPSGQSVGNNTPVLALERSRTSVRPLPPSPNGSGMFPHREEYTINRSPEKTSLNPPPPPMQLTHARGSSTDQRGVPTPSQTPSGSSTSHHRDRSRVLPGVGPPPTSALPSRPISMMKPPQINIPLLASPEPSSSDDEDISNNPLLAPRNLPKPATTESNGIRTPSPTYGIRDLPSRSREAHDRTKESISSINAVRGPLSPKRASTLPAPPSAPQSQREVNGTKQSATLRFATSSMNQPQPSPRTPVTSSGGSPPKFSHPMPMMTRTLAQSGQEWPANLPRLPRAPGQLPQPPVTQSTQPSSSRNTSPVRSAAPPQLPPRKQSLNNPASLETFNAFRGRQRQIIPPDLDDAPPPSLRRSPSPGASRSPLPASPFSPSTLPSIRTQNPPLSSPVSPPSAVTPSSAGSDFSLSQFPAPPSHTQTYRPVPPVPQVSLYSPVQPAPVNGRDTPRRQDASRTAIPKISFPADPDDDSDEDNGGPIINVSGPDTSSGPPRISINGFGGDDSNSGGMPGIPSISIGGVSEDPSPSISVSGPSSSHGHDRRPLHQKLPPLPAVLGRGGLVCGGCGGAIIGRIVNAMGARWHPGCFRCCICNEVLENLSSYEHEGRPYCHLDYHENFAPRCYHCQTAIVDELFITLDDPELGKRTYHEQHFFCAECGDPFLPPASGNRSFTGDGVFKTDEDDVGFTVYKGHPYCEACHVRLRMPKCKRCKRSIRDGMQAVEALGGKWCWECFVCASCEKPFENPSFFLRDNNPFCENCFSIMIKNEM